MIETEREDPEKRVRRECAEIAKLSEYECCKKLGDLLFKDVDNVLQMFDSIEEAGMDPDEVVELFRNARPYVRITCEKLCTDGFRDSEWDIVLHPFVTDVPWLRLHDCDHRLKQCVQLLQHRETFTIADRKVHANSIQYHSFSRNDLLLKSLDESREQIVDLFEILLPEMHYPDKRREEDDL
jgi:hypothetical protein